MARVVSRIRNALFISDDFVILLLFGHFLCRTRAGYFSWFRLHFRRNEMQLTTHTLLHTPKDQVKHEKVHMSSTPIWSYYQLLFLWAAASCESMRIKRSKKKKKQQQTITFLFERLHLKSTNFSGINKCIEINEESISVFCSNNSDMAFKVSESKNLEFDFFTKFPKFSFHKRKLRLWRKSNHQ